jgi:hypothetical protein
MATLSRMLSSRIQAKDEKKNVASEQASANDIQERRRLWLKIAALAHTDRRSSQSLGIKSGLRD